jgi:uncharacterized protein (TIGR02300 family)
VEVFVLAKAALGIKRVCPACHQPFYDLQKNPAKCPNCAHAFDPSEVLRGRRGRNTEDMRKPEEAKLAKPLDGGDVPDLTDGEEGAETEEELLEDASDLGEDEDDVSEVIDNVNEGGEER